MGGSKWGKEVDGGSGMPVAFVRRVTSVDYTVLSRGMMTVDNCLYR